MTDLTQSKVTGLLGLSMRAGLLISGQEACVEAVRNEKACVVLMDAEASPNTQKRLMDACRAHNIPLYGMAAGALGHCIGKAGRMVAALEKGGMAQQLLSLLENEPRL